MDGNQVQVSNLLPVFTGFLRSVDNTNLDGTPANVVDGLFAIARAIDRQTDMLVELDGIRLNRLMAEAEAAGDWPVGTMSPDPRDPCDDARPN